jgi:crotonobetainyl-CoA:carnitine CoA-transferase CaiB-like acyl-CoA transferase
VVSDRAHGQSPVFRPLAGVSIVELGDGVAGATATDLLAALGATVTTYVDGGSIQRLSAPAVNGQSIQSLVFDSRKRVVLGADADSVARAISAADAVVCDRVHGASPGMPVAAADYLAFVARSNPGVWATISAYGVSGSRADRIGSDLTVAASAGWLSAATDPETGRPTSMSGSQALQSAGGAAALAVCHGLSERLASGEAQHADVSAQAAAIVAGTLLSATGPLLGSDQVGGSARFGAPAGLYDCLDGAICIMAMEQHQWVGLVRALGSPEWAEQFDSVDDRIDRAAECNAALAIEFAGWNRLDLEAKLQEEGVPAGATRGPADLLASPQFVARGAVRTVEICDDQAHVLDTAQQVTAVGTSRLPDRPRTIRGLRVLEAGHVLAAPLAGALLGACGAQVVKLEDGRRPDSYRTRGPYVDGHAHHDWSAYFALANHSKHSLDIDLSRPEVVSALLQSADVLIENYGPSRARRSKIDSAQAVENHPDLLAISSSGFGHTGPWASYRAYAYNLHAAAGLVHFTRGTSGRPVHVEMAIADLMTGFSLATYVAAWAISPGGRTGVGLDVAMAEALAARFNAELAATDLGVESASTTRPERRVPYAPNGIYPSADGRWVALSILDDDQWTDLVEQLGSPTSLADERWNSAASRKAGADELDAALISEIGRFGAEELVGNLVERGVPGSVVRSPVEVFTGSDHLDAAYLPTVDHPLWGRRRLPGLPWSLTSRPTTELVPPPYLGNARDAAGTWANNLVHAVDTAGMDADELDVVARRQPARMECTNPS